MGNFTNVALWNALRSKYADFASISPKGTAELFTEKGWGEISRDNLPALNKFFSLSMQWAFNKANIATVKTRLEASGIAEVYGQESGGYLQRISMEVIKGTSPKFDLVDGTSVDPYKIRNAAKAANVKERFFEIDNFSWQSIITIQEFQLKKIWVNEVGVSVFLAGLMAGLENGYKVQKEVNLYKALHEAINSVDKPLQDTQKITLASWTDAGVTEAELLDFIAQVQDLATEMDIAITQPGFNANKFDTSVNKEDHILLVRAGILNKIKRMKALNIHYDGASKMLELPFETMEVADFGGLVHYVESEEGQTTELFPHYDEYGTVDGWSTSEGGDKEYDLNAEEVSVKDLDKSVLACVVQKGLIFEDIQNPYRVEAIHNPLGLYDNYIASAPHNMIRYDANYDLITISKPQ